MTKSTSSSQPCSCLQTSTSNSIYTLSESFLRLTVLAALALIGARYAMSFACLKFQTMCNELDQSNALPSSLSLIAVLVAVLVSKTLLSGSCIFPVTSQMSTHEIQEAFESRDKQAEKRIYGARDEIAERLAGALRFKTISLDENEAKDFEAVDKEEFLRLHKYMRKLYPRVFKNLEVHVINKYSLVMIWKGTKHGSEKPYLLTAHMDVVPCPEPERWKVPPFSGLIKDGCIWGRGAIDDKQSVFGWLEAVDDLLGNGFQPQRTIYIAFGHDEEINGFEGAKKISEWLTENVGPSNCFEFIMDEGLFIIDGALPGHNKPIAYVCIAEKGYLSVELSVRCEPGHSSNPPNETAIGILSDAVRKIEQTPMPVHFHGPAASLLGSVQMGFSGIKRLLFSNLWLFGPLVGRILSRLPGAKTMVLTTKAATIFRAGEKENILPSVARAVINHRVHPNDTLEQVLEWDRSVVNDTRVEIKAIGKPVPPAPVSDSQHPSFKGLARAIHAVHGDTCAVAPALFVAASDSRHYWAHSEQILRFNPIKLANDEVNMFHGFNERIRVDNYCELILVFRNVILNADARRVPNEWELPVDTEVARTSSHEDVQQGDDGESEGEVKTKPSPNRQRRSTRKAIPLVDLTQDSSISESEDEVEEEKPLRKSRRGKGGK